MSKQNDLYEEFQAGDMANAKIDLIAEREHNASTLAKSVTQSTLLAGEDLTNDVLKVEQRYSYHYIAAPAADEVVKASAGFVHAIILGKWVTGGTVEVSDHATDGDGNVKIKLTAGATDESGFPKTIPVNAVFGTGITVDTIGLTDVTIIYR
jgi:hypothetical protein